LFHGKLSVQSYSKKYFSVNSVSEYSICSTESGGQGKQTQRRSRKATMVANQLSMLERRLSVTAGSAASVLCSFLHAALTGLKQAIVTEVYG